MTQGKPPERADPPPPTRAPVDRLFADVYPELCGLADRWLGTARADKPVEPTALVHDAYVRLASHPQLQVKSKTHFFAIAAAAMRQILIDHARRREALKRGGGQGRLTLSNIIDGKPSGAGIDVLALHDALTRLAHLNPRHARVVEMRFFGGMDLDQIAEALEVSRRTVDTDWAAARAWLLTQLSSQEPEQSP